MKYLISIRFMVEKYAIKRKVRSKGIPVLLKLSDPYLTPFERPYACGCD